MQCIHCFLSQSIQTGHAEKNPEALFDQFNANVLIQLIKDSEKKNDIQIFLEFFKSEYADKESFMRNMLSAILRSKKEVILMNIFSYLEIVNTFEDSALVGKCISFILINPLFWNIDDKELNSSLSLIFKIMKSHSINYHFSEEYDDQLMHMLLIALNLREKSQTIILEIIIHLMSFSGTKFVPLIIEFCIISPYFAPFTDIDGIVENTCAIKNTELQVRLISIIIENPTFLKSIPFSVLLHLAVEMNFFDAKICTIELVDRMAANTIETNDNLPLIADICMKYFNDAFVWESVISKTFDKKFEFSKDWRYSYSLKNRIFIIPMLSMLIPYSGSELETDLCRTVFQIAEFVLMSEPSILTKNLVIPFFLNFVLNETKGRARQPYDFLNSKIEPEIVEKLEANYDKWKEARFDKKEKKVTRLYVEKAAKLLCNVTLAASDKVTLMKMVCQFANEKIVESYLFDFLSKFVEIPLPGELAQDIAKEIAWVSINRSNVLVNGSIESILVSALSRNQHCFVYFISFFLMRLDAMPPETIEVFIAAATAFYIRPDIQFLYSAIYIISRIIRSTLPRELPFLEVFFQKTKAELMKTPADQIPLAKNIVEADSFVNMKFSEEEMFGYDQIFSQKVEQRNNKIKNWALPFLDEYSWTATHKYFQFYVKNVLKQIDYQRKLKFFIDMCLRESECLHSALMFHNAMSNSQSLQTKKGSKATSFRISPFFSPCTVPTVLMPSRVELYPPGKKRPEIEDEERFEFLGNKAPFVFGHSKYAVSFQDNLLEQLKQTYKGREFANCTIIRLFTRVKSVIFKTGNANIYMILINASYNEETKTLKLEGDNEHYLFMRDCILDGDYGNFSMFLDHPIIILHLKQAKIYEYTSCGVASSVQVFSNANGVFIIEFNGKQTLHGFKFDLYPLKAKWKEGMLSNFDYLLAVNQAAERSFVDLSCYPIFPRVLTDFNQNEIGEFRDLSKPVQIVCDKDKEHKLLKVRFSVQGYYHSDNISNPHFVSGNLVRIAPFCNAQWELNEKWDASTRIMMSIPSHYSITNHTIYELPPESFAFPEGLINVNDFVLPNNEELRLILPAWASSPSDFINKHRNALESAEVSLNLHKWIDLVFGFKSRNQEAINELNTYHPFSYVNAGDKPTTEKYNWIQTCGQVPKQLFKDAHPRQTQQPALPSSLKSSAAVEYAVDIDNANGVIMTSRMIIKMPTNGCQNGRCDGETLVLTYARFVYACSLSSLDPLAFFFRMNSLFSVPCTKLMICATAFSSQVVIWSLANGFVIKSIKVAKPSRIVFLKNDNSIIIEYEGGRMAVTPSGTPI